MKASIPRRRIARDGTRFSAFRDLHHSPDRMRDNSALYAAIGQVARYEQFLRLIVQRYDGLSVKSKALTETIKPLLGKSAWTTEGRVALDELNSLGPHIHLEQVTFYLLSKVFLDQVARFIEHYFRPRSAEVRARVRRLSLDSHDLLTKTFKPFAEALGITYPPEFLLQLEALKARIADFRDYQIAHNKDPRLAYGTGFGEEPTMIPAIFNPRPREKTKLVQTESPTALMALVDSYIDSLLSLLSENRSKSSLLRASAP